MPSQPSNRYANRTDGCDSFGQRRRKQSQPFQDLIQAELINNFLENNNVKVRLLKGLWAKHALDQLEPTIFPCLELSPVLIVIDSSPDGSENQLLKNSWIRYQGLMKSERSVKRLLIGVGGSAPGNSADENTCSFSEINDDNMAKITELIQEAADQIEEEIETPNDALKGIREKLKNKQFDTVKTELKPLLSKNPGDYQLWWLSFLTKHQVSSEEDLKRQGLNCEKDYYFQKTYALAPLSASFLVRHSFRFKAKVVPSPEQLYEQKLSNAKPSFTNAMRDVYGNRLFFIGF